VPRRALPGISEGLRDIPYVYVQRRTETYPAREEFFTAAPAIVNTKARYGTTKFDAKRQTAMFECDLI
jgi:hypothetical protein